MDSTLPYWCDSSKRSIDSPNFLSPGRALSAFDAAVASARTAAVAFAGGKGRVRIDCFPFGKLIDA